MMNQIIALLIAGFHSNLAQDQVNGFIMTRNVACRNQNDGGLHWGLSLDECMDECNNYGVNGCKSVEYFTSHPDGNGKSLCQPSATCVRAEATKQTENGALYFYERYTGIETVEEFIMTPNVACRGQNDGGSYWDISLEECVEKCNNYGVSGCISFEYFTQHTFGSGRSLCQPSATCKRGEASTQTENGPLYFFERYTSLGALDDYFTMKADVACVGQNDGGLFWGVTLDQCLQKCNQYDGCISFEYFTSHTFGGGKSLCQPSASCTVSQATSQTQNGPLYSFFVKEE